MNRIDSLKRRRAGQVKGWDVNCSCDGEGIAEPGAAAFDFSIATGWGIGDLPGILAGVFFIKHTGFQGECADGFVVTETGVSEFWSGAVRKDESDNFRGHMVIDAAGDRGLDKPGTTGRDFAIAATDAIAAVGDRAGKIVCSHGAVLHSVFDNGSVVVHSDPFWGNWPGRFENRVDPGCERALACSIGGIAGVDVFAGLAESGDLGRSAGAVFIGWDDERA